MAAKVAARVHNLAQEIARALGPEGPQNLAQALVSTLKPEDIRGLVEELTQALVTALNLPHDDYAHDIRKLLSLFSGNSTQVLERLQEEPLLTVMSPSHYQALREALAQNTFEKVEGSPWPTATLSKGKARGQAQLRPLHVDEQTPISPEEQRSWSQMMWRQREELSDLDADVLDALSAIWLQLARSPQEDAITDIDDLLAMRNLKPKHNGCGHGRGYRPEQRAEILQALSHIQNLWLNMAELEVYAASDPGRRPKPNKQVVQSRAFVITDRLGQLRLDGCIDVQKIVFRPGKVFAYYLFGPGRQTALLSAKALHYDPYRQDWEKRLTRYFSWQWKCQAGTGRQASAYRVATLTEAAGAVPSSRRPQRTRERLERALEVLQNDGVIAAWQYERWDERIATQRDWLPTWLNSTVMVESPEAIQARYRRLDRSVPLPELPPASQDLSFGQRLHRTRRGRALSQLQAAEEMGISQAYLSLLEREKFPAARLGPEALQRVEQWLATPQGLH